MCREPKRKQTRMRPHRLSSDPRLLILSLYVTSRSRQTVAAATEACDHRFYLATFDSVRLKSHRRKSGKRGKSSPRGSRGSPPRLVADDSVRLDTPILLVRFNSGFGLRAKVTIHSARISRRS